MMRLILTIAATAIASTAASAQTCYSYGNVVTCSNGVSAYRYGNASLFGDWSVAERRRNPTPMYGDWGSAYYGNSTVFNDGRSAYTYDNTMVTIDGRTCYRSGTAFICKKVGKGAQPSFVQRR
jgi:hypothetical protein